MALLRRRTAKIAIVTATLFLCALPSRADVIPHLLDSYDITGSSSAAGGDIYTMGVAASARFGSSEDLSNHQTDLHFNYTSDLAPDNPDDQNSPVKQSNVWGGGAKIDLWEGGSLGVDLDALNDHFEGLSTNGQKITIGVDPFKLSYRFGRNSVTAPLLNKPNVTGAVIYQHTFELDYDWKVNDESSFSFDAAYSIFNPPAPQFGTLLSGAALTTFSNFQDTLLSFEQWKFGGSWIRLWTDLIDTTMSAHLSHEIIPANPLIDTIIDLGFHVTRNWHLQVGWEYSHDPTLTLNTASIEIRWSWDRTGEIERGSTSHENPEAVVTP